MALKQYCDYLYEDLVIPGDFPHLIESINFNGTDYFVPYPIMVEDEATVIAWLISIGFTDVTYVAHSDTSLTLNIKGTDGIMGDFIMSYIDLGSPILSVISPVQSNCKYLFDPAVVRGCTDSGATNYNALATEDDATCEYAPVDERQVFAASVAHMNGCMEKKELIGATITKKQREQSWYINAVLKTINREPEVGEFLQETVLPYADVDVSGLVGIVGVHTFTIMVTTAGGEVHYIAQDVSADFTGYDLFDIISELNDHINGSADEFTGANVSNVLVVTAPEGSDLTYAGATIDIIMSGDYHYTGLTPATTNSFGYAIATTKQESSSFYGKTFAGKKSGTTMYVIENGLLLASVTIPVVIGTMCIHETSDTLVVDTTGFVNLYSINPVTYALTLISSTANASGGLNLVYNGFNQKVYGISLTKVFIITAANAVSSTTIVTAGTVPASGMLSCCVFNGHMNFLTSANIYIIGIAGTILFTVASTHQSAYYNGIDIGTSKLIVETADNNFVYREVVGYTVTDTFAITASGGSSFNNLFVDSEHGLFFYTRGSVAVVSVQAKATLYILDSAIREFYPNGAVYVPKYKIIAAYSTTGSLYKEFKLAETTIEEEFTDGVGEIISEEEDGCLTHDEQTAMISNATQLIHECL